MRMGGMRGWAAAIGLAIVVLVAGGWAFGWHWAAGETARTLDDWMAREARVGRHWSCPNRAVSGFPAKIVVTCSNVRFEGEIVGRSFAGRLGGFEAEASLFHPRILETVLQSPFALQAAGGEGALDLTWTALDVDLTGLPDAPLETGMRATGLTLKGDVAAWGHLEGAADRITANVVRRTDRTDNAYDLRMAMDGGRVPFLDLLLGAPASTAATLAGTLSQIDFTAGGSAAARLDLWRQLGGRVEIAMLRISHGAASVGGSGNLLLDGAHRPEGRLDARFAGLEPVLRRFGVDPGLVAATGLIGSLLGGRNGGQANDGGGLRLPITLAGGRVAIGPVRTGIPLPPLY